MRMLGPEKAMPNVCSMLGQRVYRCGLDCLHVHMLEVWYLCRLLPSEGAVGSMRGLAGQDFAQSL